jgi:hypothetical protein
LTKNNAIIHIGGKPLTVVGDGNVIEGNYIGTNVGGTAAAGNLFGVSITGSSNRIGGTSAQQRNLIDGTRDTGCRNAVKVSPIPTQ